jgi:N-acetylmuramoyl-L-alanine amidase CwlA
MLNNRLNETKIGSAKVIVDILPSGKVIPNTKITTTSITIHQTGNIDTTAKNNHNYMKNLNKNGGRTASWHFTVDDIEIYQAVPTNYKAWHAGNATGNNSSIGIEICMFTDATRQRKAYQNAIELVKVLMKFHKFDVSKVKRHKDWSGKHCPAWLIEGKYGMTWDWFKAQCGAATTTAAPSGEFRVRILEELNVRKGPSTTYNIVTTVKTNQVYTIVETSGNWGKLKSGVGWISIHPKYVKRL